MQARRGSIEGVWEFVPVLRPDDRGVFLESFKGEVFADTVGHPLELAQMNISVSRSGTVRGVHFADVPPGQAKYVQCFAGRILDVVVDIRVGSPTFGQWDAVELDDQQRNGLYVAEGLGHAFCALSDAATIGTCAPLPTHPRMSMGSPRWIPLSDCRGPMTTSSSPRRTQPLRRWPRPSPPACSLTSTRPPPSVTGWLSAASRAACRPPG